jgi:tRNA1Val (adenine37-N6)-methyltransferase
LLSLNLGALQQFHFNLKKTSPFKFKKFIIQHDKCSMKVGTDAVLLGAWVNVDGIKNILEVGAGSGVISLMLAQRTGTDTKIEAIEIEKGDAQQAKENVERSPWPEKVTTYHQAFQTFTSPKLYDLIISNPPYFNNSQLPPSDKRSQARHTGSLSYTELISLAIKLLNPLGKLAVVLPFEEGKIFQSLALECNLHPSRQLKFHSREGKPQERWLFEFAFGPTELSTEKLILHAVGEEWTEDYKMLTRDFYLKL